MRRWITAAIVALALVAPSVAWAQQAVTENYGTATFTSNTSLPAQCLGQSSAWFHETSGAPGPVDVQASNDNVNWTTVGILDAANTSHGQPFTPNSGIDYRITPASFKYIEVVPDSTWSTQTGAILLRCSTAPDTSAVASGGGGGSGCTISSPCYNYVQISPSPSPWPLATPGNIPQVNLTDVSGNALFSPAPLPTAAGVAPASLLPQVGSQGMCFYTTTVISLTTGNQFATRCDSRGHAQTSICGNNTTTCAGQVAGVQSAILAGIIPSTEVAASGASGTCTAVVTGTAVLVNVMYASTSAQTGTLTIYNEGATPSCTSTDAIYASATHAATGTADTPLISASAGLAYKWTTAGQNGVVLIGYF